ncbi:MAG: Hpt domain-containing protein [Magnetococcales bacterium]|nr:Hpt domain-containing protein [Magnetococcales bacterium]
MNETVAGHLPLDNQESLVRVSERNTCLDLQKLAEMKQECGPGFSKVLQHFKSGILVRPAKIQQAFQAKDLAQVAVESHALKSVCRQIGLLYMGDLADNLESLARSGQLRGAESLVEELMQAGQSAYCALTEYCTSNDPSGLFLG